MEQTVYKIGEVSARLGLVDKNNNTLRSWTEEFKEFLSATANPPPGQPRRYTRRDVQVLTAVRDYRTNHLSYDEVRERLRAGELDVTGPDPDDDDDDDLGAGGARPGLGQSLAPLAPTQMEALLAPLVASVDEWRRLAEEYRTRLEGREERIEVLEQRVEALYERLDRARAVALTAAPASATAPGATQSSAATEAPPSADSTAQASGETARTVGAAPRGMAPRERSPDLDGQGADLDRATDPAPSVPDMGMGAAQASPTMTMPAAAAAIFPLPTVTQARQARDDTVGRDSIFRDAGDEAREVEVKDGLAASLSPATPVEPMAPRRSRSWWRAWRGSHG